MFARDSQYERLALDLGFRLAWSWTFWSWVHMCDLRMYANSRPLAYRHSMRVLVAAVQLRVVVVVAVVVIVVVVAVYSSCRRSTGDLDWPRR